MFCPTCGIENPDSARFCKNCGSQFAAAAPPPPPAHTPPPAPPPPPVQAAPPPPPAYTPPPAPPAPPPPAYSQPLAPPPAYTPPPVAAADAGSAREKVKIPAFALMGVAALGILWQLFWMVVNILGAGASLMGGMASDMPAEMGGEMASMMSGGIGILFGVIAIACGVVVLLAAMKMKNLQSWVFSMIGAIVAAVPCLSPCCCLGLPVGIWALIVLLNKDVKAAFA